MPRPLARRKPCSSSFTRAGAISQFTPTAVDRTRRAMPYAGRWKSSCRANACTWGCTRYAPNTAQPKSSWSCARARRCFRIQSARSVAPHCSTSPSTPQRRLSAESRDRLAPSDTGATGRAVARATTIATESRLAVAFAPSPSNTPSASEPHGPGVHSPIAPISYFGASESITAERSAVSSWEIGTRYSRLNGAFTWPIVNTSGAGDQRTYASRRLGVAGFFTPAEASNSTSTRYANRLGSVPSAESRARFSSMLTPAPCTATSRTCM